MDQLYPEGKRNADVPLTPGVRAGDFVFVSGQVATDADGTIFVGDFEAEVNSALDNVAAVLAAADATFEHIVKINAYITNATLFARFNEIYAKRFPKAFPARTTTVLGFGHPDVRIEIEAIAYLG